jgi:diacylglycerol kinase family enzyme
MYFYIIDPQKINQKHFERVQNQLYSCVSELRISGEFSRVTALRSINQLVDTAFLREATTIVAVGFDSTVQDVINALGDKEMAIGYVPLQPSELSDILGITDVESACKNLAQRRVESLNLGEINGQYFFTNIGIGLNLETIKPNSIFDFTKFSQAANLQPKPINLEVDGLYKASFEVTVGAIINSRAVRGKGSGIADPTDDLLDVLLLPKISSMDAWKYRNELAAAKLENIPGTAVMHGRKILITSTSDLPLYSGAKILAKAPATVEISQRKVKMIVGKDRTF